MQQRRNFFPIFLLFFILSLIIFFFSQRGLLQGVTGVFEQGAMPLQRMMFHTFKAPEKLTPEEKFGKENATLLTQLAKQKELEKENQALRDQFQTTSPTPKKLLPAEIIGMDNDTVMIDKGQADGVKVGSVVVFKDNLVGKIMKTSVHRAIVAFVSQEGTSLTAATIKTGALGVVQGKGADALVFENVVLSDKLDKDDIVVTKGDIDSQGVGYPPGLVVGKIVSVNKKASALFQKAEIKSLVDFSRLQMVFVMTDNQ